MEVSTIEIRVDGIDVAAPTGATLLEACGIAGIYVAHLCSCPGFGCCKTGSEKLECGLCAVRLEDGSLVLACNTAAVPGMNVTTQDSGLSATRRERLARILYRHPHVCLGCLERDGCARDHCTYGHPAGALCCDEFGRCELGRVAAYIDPESTVAKEAVIVEREAVMEGRIRREPGLCIGCGRCVMVCEPSSETGKALVMTTRPHPSDLDEQSDGGADCDDATSFSTGLVARPKRETLRASGCAFCGRCVMVCPAGALTAPGKDGARWLADRRARSGLVGPVLPPETWREIGPASLGAVPSESGVFELMDSEGRILRIGGAADMREGLKQALREPACFAAARFRVETHTLFTQRESELLARYTQEHGCLPSGNDLADDLFGESLLEEDL
jgi:predicted molibdopterin-dependent oxidoreductase YjgC